MKRILALLLVIAATDVNAQQGGTKPAAAAPQFKNLTDSASYAIGMSVANFYKQQGITKINSAMVLKGMNDILNGKATQLDDASAGYCVNKYMNIAKTEKSKSQIEEGKKFMAANKTKPNIKTTASGIQYEVLQEGSGDKPTATSRVTCNYRGTLLNGTEFDNSYSRGQPATFSLQQVIAGWVEGLQLMSPGAKYRFWIPYNLAYGVNGRNNIPGGATLYFEIELISFEK